MDQPFDLSDLTRNLSGNEEMALELLEDFMNYYASRLEEMREAIDQEKPSLLRRSAHSFKGAVANFNAPHARKLAMELENIGKSGTVEHADVKWKALSEEMVRFEAYYRQQYGQGKKEE